MNVKLDSKTFMDTLKDDPVLQLAALAIFAIAVVGVLLTLLANGLANRAELLNAQLAQYEKEQSRQLKRCEDANGQYVRYQGEMTCLSLPFNPQTDKER
jgi:hypothetical protein